MQPRQRAWALFSVGFLSCALLFVLFAPLAALWPTLAWRNRLSLVAGRWWSRICLRICGVRPRYEGLEHLDAGAAVLTFNHTNHLDFFLLSRLAKAPCLVFGKAELARVVFLGWGWALGGHPLIRRDDRAHWQRELDRVEALLRQGWSTIVAPEGSRSRDGRVQPFKKGGFHLALRARLPVLPVVILGGAPRWRGGPVPGEVTVRVLAPISTADWREETLDAHVADVRRRYLELLEGSEVGGGDAVVTGA